MWWALAVWRPRCRVSILRCELLLGYAPRNMFLVDKGRFDHPDRVNRANDTLRKLGLPLIADERELFTAEVIVVPSIPQFDPLPDRVRDF
jgi:hypothetical protein